jgi:hypothetical protein
MTSRNDEDGDKLDKKKINTDFEDVASTRLSAKLFVIDSGPEKIA